MLRRMGLCLPLRRLVDEKERYRTALGFFNRSLFKDMVELLPIQALSQVLLRRRSQCVSWNYRGLDDDVSLLLRQSFFNFKEPLPRQMAGKCQ